MPERVAYPAPPPARLWRLGEDLIQRSAVELQRLRAFLEDVESKNWTDADGATAEAEEVADIDGRVDDLANVVELMDARRRRRRAPSRYAHFPLELAELCRIRAMVKEIESRIERAKISNISDVSTSEKMAVTGGRVETFVGLEESTKKCTDMLLNGGSELLMCALVGMAGVGKTTLARKVFNDKRVKDHFSAFAWATITVKCNLTQLLKDLFEQVGGSCVDDGSEEIGPKVKEVLNDRRYLIVLDNACNVVFLEAIKYFPNVGNGSRILITTCNRKIAEDAIHFQPPLRSTVVELPLLDDAESWEFLMKTAPGASEFKMNDKLKLLGQRVAAKCGGLRLALSILGEKLSADVSYASWSKVEENWQSVIEWQRCFDRFTLCYRSLPNLYTRKCFLYMASCHEGGHISVSKLIRSWIAEGFIQKMRGCIIEETARDYLDQLIQLSLVQVAERSETLGYVTKIRIHPMLHCWCITEAWKSKFLNVIDSCTTLAGSSSSASLKRVVIRNINMDNHVFVSVCNARTILGDDLNAAEVNVQSLQNPDRFCQLRVLNLQCSRGVGNLLKEISNMTYLRYLGLRNTDVSELPPSIGDLLLLQTLDARGSQIAKLPRSFWNIQTLRNVYWDGATTLRLLAGTTKNLHKLCIETTEEWDDIDSNWKRLFRLLQKQDDLSSLTIKACYKRSIPLEEFHVPQLRFLKLFGVLDGLLGITEFLQGLTELTLKWCSLKEDPMPVLEMLPNLKRLAFEHNAYVGRTLSCSDGGFPQLLYLMLEGWNISKRWMVQGGAMPILACLLISRCFFLTEIPDELRFLTSLKQLELSDVPDELGTQIRKDVGKDWYKIRHIPSIKSTKFEGPTFRE